MARIGFHSGELAAKRIKSSGNYITESKFLGNANTDFKFGHTLFNHTKSDFNVTLISGGSVAAEQTFIAGGSPQAMACYEFTNAAAKHLGFMFVAPESLPCKTKCVLDLYWTSNLSGIVAAFNSGVVWDANYWCYSVLVSGSEVSGRNYNISGANSTVIVNGNTTYSSKYRISKNCWAISGVVCKAPLEIPAGDIAAGDLVKVVLYRDVAETADDFDSDAMLLGLFIEYVEV